jgi:hypothetical protein
MRSQLSADYKAKLRQRIEEVKPKRHVKVMNEESARLQGRNLRDVQTGGHHGATLAIVSVISPLAASARSMTYLLLGPGSWFNIHHQEQTPNRACSSNTAQ